MKKPLKNFLIVLAIIILILFLIRISTSKEIDDVSPGINCEKEYLEKSDTLWVIPSFKDNPISENKEWCQEILSLNKTLGLHGIKHTYWEFKRNDISAQELKEGIEEFENCFGYKPEKFKPPNLRLNKENKQLIKENNLELKNKINQFTHKTYHCNNSGILSNKFIDIF